MAVAPWENSTYWPGPTLEVASSSSDPAAALLSCGGAPPRGVGCRCWVLDAASVVHAGACGSRASPARLTPASTSQETTLTRATSGQIGTCC